jgi:ketopantoate reductase
VDTLAEGVEVLDAALPEHDDLAVEDVAAGREVELGEVAGKVARVARVQGLQLPVDERERAEAVPLGLVGPAVALRQR